MKKSLLLLCMLLTSFLIQAQIQPLTTIPTYTSTMDTKLQLLDKNDIQTNILYNRVFPMANLTDFNQTAIDTSNTNHFYTAYAELQTADYNHRWSSVGILKNQVQNQRVRNIPIGIINVDFEILDERAVVDNLIDITSPDSLLIDVPNRPRSPYLTKTALVASPLLQETHSKTVTFETNGIYNMQAAAKTISTVQVDFKNGQGYQTLPANGTKIVTYTFTGLKHLKFKITFSDNSVQYTYARLKVNASNPTLSENYLQNRVFNCSAGTLYASRKFQGYNETKAYSGAGEYVVVQGGNSLDKPVIVLDGFDPYEGTNDKTDLNTIYNFLFYNTGHLGSNLSSDNFDIIPLNFIKYKATDGTIINGGTDYVERNAMVLIDLIQQVNQCKTGGEQIQVVGFSMGGLVARYALRYMEQHNIPHNVDLMVTVDTPHKGATVPIGFQEMADLIDDITPFGLGNPVDDLLETPAAKQMLIHHYFANSKPPEGAPNFHDRFYNELEAMGLPQETRNIAVSNGVSNGLAIENPGQNYLNANIFEILAIVNTRAKLNYAPNRGQTKEALNFKISLDLVFTDLTLFKRIRKTTTLTAQGSYENSPGGFYGAERLVDDFYRRKTFFGKVLRNILKSLIIGIEANGVNFSFVPVKSSLAYNGSNQDLYEDFSERNLICTGETPFDSYFTSTTGNQEHIELNNSSANFIEQEIRGNKQLPNVDDPIQNFINGPKAICNTDTVYTIENCNNLDVTWTTSSNLQKTNPTNTSVTISPINSTVSGTGYIRVNIADSQFQKDIYIGKPSYSFNLGWDEAARMVVTSLVAPSGSDISLQEINNVTWEVESTSGGGFVPGGGCSGLSCIARGPFNSNNWSVEFKVTASNACGSKIKYITVTPPPPVSSKEEGTYVFNNNANNIYTINYIKDGVSLPINTFENLQPDFKITAYDFTGNPVRETRRTKIDLSSQKCGMYILKAMIDDTVLTKKVIR